MAIEAGESQYHAGVKNLCEKGITRVPLKYILPETERPINPSRFGDDCEYKKLNDNVDNLKLPIIDFAQLQGSNRRHAIASLAKACQEYGFFQVLLLILYHMF